MEELKYTESDMREAFDEGRAEKVVPSVLNPGTETTAPTWANFDEWIKEKRFLEDKIA